MKQTMDPDKCVVSKRLVETCTGGCVDGECSQKPKDLTGHAIQVTKPELEVTEECNNNFICETGENYGNCNNDCPSGSPDNYCDGVEDDICDPDCSQDSDKDCGGAWSRFVGWIKSWLFGAPA